MICIAWIENSERIWRVCVCLSCFFFARQTRTIPSQTNLYELHDWLLLNLVCSFQLNAHSSITQLTKVQSNLPKIGARNSTTDKQKSNPEHLANLRLLLFHFGWTFFDCLHIYKSKTNAISCSIQTNTLSPCNWLETSMCQSNNTVSSFRHFYREPLYCHLLLCVGIADLVIQFKSNFNRINT